MNPPSTQLLNLYLISCVMAWFFFLLAQLVYQKHLCEAGVDGKHRLEKAEDISFYVFMQFWLSFIWPLYAAVVFAWALGGFIGSVKWATLEEVERRREQERLVKR